MQEFRLSVAKPTNDKGFENSQFGSLQVAERAVILVVYEVEAVILQESTLRVVAAAQHGSRTEVDASVFSFLKG